MNDYLKQQLDQINQKIAENQKLLSDPELASLAQAEISELERQKNELQSSTGHPTGHLPGEQGRHLEGGPAEPTNPDSCILEIRSATGGDEAGIFAGDLFRMYTKFAQNKGWRVEELDRSEGKLGQIKEIVLKIKGLDSYSSLKNESGVHRVQRIPVTESGGRIHTSTATVAVLPQISPTQVVIKSRDLEFAAFRSGGHGGQNVNKVSTAVRIKHIPTGIAVTAQSERFQAQNRENAMQLLRSKLWQMETEKKQREISGERSTQVGTGERSEKIRTYNFPQNRVTDHRIGKSWHNLEEIMDGDLDDIVTALKTH